MCGAGALARVILIVWSGPALGLPKGLARDLFAVVAAFAQEPRPSMARHPWFRHRKSPARKQQEVNPDYRFALLTRQ